MFRTQFVVSEHLNINFIEDNMNDFLWGRLNNELNR